MIFRRRLFDAVRARFGALSQAQVDGVNAILDVWEARGLTDLRWLAYILATAWHETGRTMQPVREVGRGICRGRAVEQHDLKRAIHHHHAYRDAGRALAR